MKRWWQAAIFCGATPLVLGGLIFLGWALTGDTRFETLGLLNIIGGLVLFLAGVVCTVVYAVLAYRRKFENWDMQTWKAGVLLAANFPAAFLLIAVSAKFDPAFHITVENHTGDAVQNIVILARTLPLEFGDLPPNSEIEKTFRFSTEGGLHYTVVQQGIPKEGLLNGYISGSMGAGNYKLIFKEDDSTEVCRPDGACGPEFPDRVD